MVMMMGLMMGMMVMVMIPVGNPSWQATPITTGSLQKRGISEKEQYHDGQWFQRQSTPVKRNKSNHDQQNNKKLNFLG